MPPERSINVDSELDLKQQRSYPAQQKWLADFIEEGNYEARRNLAIAPPEKVLSMAVSTYETA